MRPGRTAAGTGTPDRGAAAELRRRLDLLRDRAWLVVEAVVVVALAAGIVSSLQPNRYEATARVLLRQNDPSEHLDPANAGRALTDPNRHARAQEEIVRSEAVAQLASEHLPGMTARDVERAVSVGTADLSDVLRISAVDRDPATARDIANAVAAGYIENRRLAAVRGLERAAQEIEAKLGPLLVTIAQLDGQIAQLGSQPGATASLATPAAPTRPAAPLTPPRTEADRGELATTSEGLKAARYAAALQYESLYGRLQELQVEIDLKQGEAELIAEARRPTEPVSPRPLRNAALGGFVGLLLGAGYAFARDQLDDRLRTAQEAEELTGLPVLAEVPFDTESAASGQPAVVDRPTSPLSESLRSLRTAIHYLGVDRPVRTIVVTSAVPGEGKSVVSANLAAACAQADLRTVLVSGDLRRTRRTGLLGAAASAPGLTDLLAPPANGAGTNGSASPAGGPGTGSQPGVREVAAATVVKTPIPKLAYVPPGPTPPNPAELLASRRMADLLRDLARSADVVVVDTPPLLAVTDAAIVAAHADGVVLVASVGETRRDELQRAVTVLARTEARLLGLVANKVRADRSPYHYGRYDTPADADRSPRRRWPWARRR